MVKQRNPQGQRPVRKPPATRTAPAYLKQVEPPVEAVETSAPAVEVPTESPAASVHEQLMESVSPEAVATEPESTVPDAETQPEPALEATVEAAEPVSDPEPVESVAEAGEPAEVQAAPSTEAEPAIVAQDEATAFAEKATETSAEAVEQAAAVVQAVQPAVVVPLPEPAAPPRAPSFPRGRAGFVTTRMTTTQFDIEGIGARFATYVRDESAAAFSHMRALGSAKSPADMIRLQVSEMQRAADASLTCWSDIARKASRFVEFR